MSVRAVPEGFHTLTPNLVCKNAAGAIDFYAKVFGAKELSRVAGPHGEIMHAELQIGETTRLSGCREDSAGMDPHRPRLDGIRFCGGPLRPFSARAAGCSADSFVT